MNDNLKTVEDVDNIPETEIISESDVLLEDPILKIQREDIAKMRSSLLCCNGDTSLIKRTLTDITVMRIYHEMSRIIRYTEMMDKIEDKMYESMSYAVEHANAESSGTWLMLMEMQKGIQKSMSNSYNLLKPYLSLSKTDMSAMATAIDTNVEAIPLDTKSRDSIRSTAQHILSLLGDPDD